MSTSSTISGISSSLLSEIASSPSSANQFVTDLNQLAQDLKSGNLSAAQEDYVTLSNDAQNGVTSSAATTSTSGITGSLLSDVASSSTASGSFLNELNVLGTDLSNGDLADAQTDMTTLESTANAAAPATTSSAASTASSSSSVNKAEIAALIKATIDAMSVNDDSSISTDLSELASVSINSKGASVLQSESASYGASASSSSSSGSLSGLLDSLNSSASSSSNPLLSLLA